MAEICKVKNRVVDAVRTPAVGREVKIWSAQFRVSRLCREDLQDLKRVPFDVRQLCPQCDPAIKYALTLWG